MKLLLVGSNRDTAERIHKRFGAQGVDVIHYTHPIKAMDNLEEVKPEVVLFAAGDFPRHWKTFLTFLRGQLYRDRCVFVLLTPPGFSEDDAIKAHHLGANGLINDSLTVEEDLVRLQDVIARYRDLRESRSARRHKPGEHDRVEFLATHPKTLQLIFGTVRDISAGGLAFIPQVPAGVTGLQPGTMIPSATLRIGETILTLTVTVVRHEETLSLMFDPLRATHADLIEQYFGDTAERRLGAPSGS